MPRLNTNPDVVAEREHWRSKIEPLVEKALAAGYLPSEIGSVVASDPSFIYKLRSNHPFMLDTLVSIVHRFQRLNYKQKSILT
jgi:hypothetical protein